MVNLFETHLQRFINCIMASEEKRRVYIEDFIEIRDYVLDIMSRMDHAFQWIFRGASKYEICSSDMYIVAPNEFNVLVKLSLPFTKDLEVQQDFRRPGFVVMDVGNVLNALCSMQGYGEVFDLVQKLSHNTNCKILNGKLQNWFGTLIVRSLDCYGGVVTNDEGDVYTLQYVNCDLMHTIFASCSQYQEIIINFIPVFTFGIQDWMEIPRFRPFLTKCNRWYAIPISTRCIPHRNRISTFMICNPKVENDLILKNKNIKIVLWLLRSLCDKYELYDMKSYFLISAILWEIQSNTRRFWNQPISILLVHMVSELFNYFDDNTFPFYWDRTCNLLQNWSKSKIRLYTNKLYFLNNLLGSYLNKPALSYGCCIRHFKIRFENLD